MATVKAYFYTTADADNVVSKNISVISANVDIDLTENCTRERPRLFVKASSVPNIANVNYMYINVFNRYYYVDDITLTRNGMLYVTGHVDVLKSFESGIKGLSCLVDRNEYVFNAYIEDNMIVPRVERIVSKKVVGSLGNEITYAITLTGGGGSEE